MKTLKYNLDGIEFLEFEPQFRTIKVLIQSDLTYYSTDLKVIKLPFPYLRFAAIKGKAGKRSYLLVNAGEQPLGSVNDLFYSLPLPNVYVKYGGWSCLGDSHTTNNLDELINYFWFSKFNTRSGEGYSIKKVQLTEWSKIDLDAKKIINLFKSFGNLEFKIDKIKDFKAQYGSN